MTKFCNTRSARSAALESTESSVAVAPQRVDEIVDPLLPISEAMYSQTSRETRRCGFAQIQSTVFRKRLPFCGRWHRSCYFETVASG